MDTMRDLRRHGIRRFRKTTAAGLVPLLLLTGLPGCVARHMPDWSEVQAVAPETKTEVQMYEDSSPQGGRKIKGHFLSATDDSIKLQLKDGSTRTLPRSDVRKVLTRRPFAKRWPGWVALGVTFGVLQTLLSMTASVDNVSGSTMVGVHAVYTLPITAAFFYGSRMEGIYEEPSNWFPPETNSSEAGEKKPENPK